MLDLFTQLDDHQGKSHVEVEFPLGIGVEPTMSGENDLAVKKLQAEIDKIHVETTCLRADLQQSQNAVASKAREDAELYRVKAETAKFNEETKKLQGDKRVWRRENAIAFLTALSMGVSIIIGGVSIIVGFFTFLDQQSDRDKFNVTTEVIKLVDRLRTSNDGSYAILLAAYEEHAVPILLVSLNKVGSETFVTGVIDALKLIAEKKPNAVIPMLNNRTRSIFKAVTDGDASKFEPLLNYIEALGHLRKLGSTNESEKTLSELYTKLKCSENKKPSGIEVKPEDRTSICTILKKANPLLGKRDG